MKVELVKGMVSFDFNKNIEATTMILKRIEERESGDLVNIVEVSDLLIKWGYV